MWKRVAVSVAASLTAPAFAELASVSDTGFVSRHSVETSEGPDAIYALLGTPDRWWNGSHTYSGSAANLSMAMKAGGCFCETVPATGATIEHAHVIYAEQGKRLRLSGGFGPLQSEAVTGTLDFVIVAKPNGGSTITLTYVVGGYSRTSLAALAKPVHAVMGEQLAGLAKAIAAK